MHNSYPLALRLLLLFAAALLSCSSLAAQCFYSVAPNSQSFPATGGTGLVTIAGTPTSCAWTTVSNSPPWLTVSFGQNGTGNGSAGFAVARNTSAASRTGTLTIAGQTVTVTQAAAVCDFRVTPASATLSAAGGAGTLIVETTCSWTASSNANWLTVSTGAGSGDGTVTFAAPANTTGASRTANIIVGSTTVSVTQTAACTLTFSPGAGSFAAVGGAGTVSITASAASCDRAASSAVSWITLTSGQTGTGNGSIQYTVAANPSPDSRTGTIQIGDQILTVNQFGGTCVYNVSPQQATVQAAGGVGTFAVATTCAWTAVSDSGWLSVTNGSSGTGNGAVSYAAAANLASSPRTGSIRVGGTAFILTQTPQSCTITMDPASATTGSEGGPGSFQVSAASSCSWGVQSQASWLAIAGSASGTGPGTISYNVQPNASTQTRVGTITVGSAIFRLTQSAANCSLSLASSAVSLPAAGGSGSFDIRANCAWTANSSAGWVQIASPSAGSANATVSFTVQPNTSGAARTGAILVNGQTFSVRQAGGSCIISLGTAAAMLPARGGTAIIAVRGGPACDWVASSDSAFLNVAYAAVSGSGNVTLAAEPNTTGQDRMATVSISGQTAIVTQPAISIRIAANGVLNAASFTGGSVAPGEILTIYGTGFGPADLNLYQLTSDRQSFTKVVADTRVLFDGNAAPMIYVTEGQLSAIVPYAVGGKQTTELVVEYFGVKSSVLTIPVTAAAPAIFSSNASGKGPGAILNQDYSVNSASRPARIGSAIQIFATGEGQTRPAGIDGKLAASPLPAPVLPVSVRIGGVEARVQYAGAAPGLVSGLVQINAVIPAGVPTGTSLPIVLRVGEAQSPEGITVAVAQ